MQLNLEFWIDNNLPPQMAIWLKEGFNVSAKSFFELNFQNTEDTEVFKIAANKLNTIIITTKDVDFVKLSDQRNSLPKILYLNVGNISNKKLKELIDKSFRQVLQTFIETDELLVEINNAHE